MEKEKVVIKEDKEKKEPSNGGSKKKIIAAVVAVVVIVAVIGVFLLTRKEGDGNGGNGNGNQPPIADFTYLPTDVYANQTVNFNAQGSTDPDGDELEYSWDFDDLYADSGNPNEDSGITASHIFTMPGVYNVTLIVSDGEKTDKANETITVMPEEIPTVTLNAVKTDPMFNNIEWKIFIEGVDGTGDQLDLNNILYKIYNGTNTDQDKKGGPISDLKGTITDSSTSPPYDADIYFDDTEDNSVLSNLDYFSIAGDGGADIQDGDGFQLLYKPPYFDKGVPMCDPEPLP